MIHELRPRLFPLLLASAAVLPAHDAPARVTVQLHLRPAGNHLQVLARIPLEAVRDVDWPLRDGTPYLDPALLAPRLPGLAELWITNALELYEDGVRAAPAAVTATQLSLPSDRSFATAAGAAARLRAPLPSAGENLIAKQLFFDAAFQIPLRRPGAALSLKPAFAHLGEQVQTVVHYRDRTLLLSGEPEAFPLEPTWFGAAWLFVKLGFEHILGGLDHLLFVLCLVIPTRRLRALLGIITAFTAAHSLTLIASGLGLAPGAAWFPPAVELVIAVSILYLALANLAGAGSHHSWRLAFAFGLVHGFGFSFALRESLQFAGPHLLAALFSFNLGVELGQIAALAIMVPALHFLFPRVLPERLGALLASALVAHTAWHWMTERAAALWAYPFTLTAAEGALALRWLIALLILGALAARFPFTRKAPPPAA